VWVEISCTPSVTQIYTLLTFVVPGFCNAVATSMCRLPLCVSNTRIQVLTHACQSGTLVAVSLVLRTVAQITSARMPAGHAAVLGPGSAALGASARLFVRQPYLPGDPAPGTCLPPLAVQSSA